jgi:hypothetical protein
MDHCKKCAMVCRECSNVCRELTIE